MNMDLGTGKHKTVNRSSGLRGGHRGAPLPDSIYDLLYYCAAFVIPALGMTAILFSRHFYPFGENTLFTGDMRAQYAEFYASLRYLFSGDNSFFCSWSRSWGGNYLGLFAYYLASPLSFLVNFFPLEKLYVGILFLTICKIGLCGLTFSVFALYMLRSGESLVNPISNVKSVASEHGASQELATANVQHIPHMRKLLLPFAVSYALMSYNIVYSQALMWLDGVIWLPLVILGVEKLLENRRGLLLVLTFTMAFLSNYYTGYMIAIFAFLYLLFRLCTSLTRPGLTDVVNRILHFLCCGLLSAGLSAPLLLPVFLDLFAGKLTGTTVSSQSAVSFSFLNFFHKLIPGAYDSLTYSNLPYVYCSYLALGLSILYFALRRIPLREKLGTLLLGIFLFLGMYLTKLNLIWHGFQLPNSYPFRNSFLFSFFILCLALEAARRILPWLFTKLTGMHRAAFPVFALFVLACVSIDMGLNGRAILFHVEDEYDYDTVTDYENYLVTTEPLISGILSSDAGFYRINQLYEYSKNDALLWGYNGLSHYSSTYNQSVNNLTRNLGMAADWLWNAGYGATPLTNSLLSVKYVLTRFPLPEPYIPLQESGYGTFSYENPLTLPIAYTAPLTEYSPAFGEDVFTNQNLLLGTILGEQIDCFEPVSFECSFEQRSFDQSNFDQSSFDASQTSSEAPGWTYSLTAPSTDPLYLMMPADGYTHTEVYVNDRFVGNYFSSETKCCLYLGIFSTGESITVNVRPSADIEVTHPQIYSLSLDKLQAALNSLRANGMQITEHKRGTLKGLINLPAEDANAAFPSGEAAPTRGSEASKPAWSIVTSIPFDRGWSVKIDGKKVPTHCFADTFLVVPAASIASLSPGEHYITFSYLSPGVLPGLGLHILSLSLILWDIWRRRRLWNRLSD